MGFCAIAAAGKTVNGFASPSFGSAQDKQRWSFVLNFIKIIFNHHRLGAGGMLIRNCTKHCPCKTTLNNK
jgi:hypothetical protein